MYNNNFYKWIKAKLSGVTISSSDPASVRPVTLSGTVSQYHAASNGGCNLPATGSTTSYSTQISIYNNQFKGTTGNVDPTVEMVMLQLGTGTTPPTEDDYCLESVIPDEMLSDQMSSVSYWMNTDTKTLYVVTHTVRNNSSSPITVSELGISFRFRCLTSSSTAASYANFLLSRTVLENPVTIQPGEMYTFADEIVLFDK